MNVAMSPTVAIPCRAIQLPTPATMAMLALLSILMRGMMSMAYMFALMLITFTASLVEVNFRFTDSCCSKAITTLWPPMVSCIVLFSTPRFVMSSRKPDLVLVPTTAVMPTIKGNTMRLARASQMLRLNIITTMPTRVMELLISWVTF